MRTRDTSTSEEHRQWGVRSLGWPSFRYAHVSPAQQFRKHSAPFQRSRGGCKCRSYTTHLSARADNGYRPKLVIADPRSRSRPGWSARRDQCTMWGLQMCSLRWSSPFGRVRLGTTPLAPAEAVAASSSCSLRPFFIPCMSTQCCSLAESAVARGCRPFAATLEPFSATPPSCPILPLHRVRPGGPAQQAGRAGAGCGQRAGGVGAQPQGAGGAHQRVPAAGGARAVAGGGAAAQGVPGRGGPPDYQVGQAASCSGVAGSDFVAAPATEVGGSGVFPCGAVPRVPVVFQHLFCLLARALPHPHLPARSKAAEGAFLELYQRLYEAPDPAPALAAGLELASRATQLEAEAAKMAQASFIGFSCSSRIAGPREKGGFAARRPQIACRCSTFRFDGAVLSASNFFPT
jgi:hypothetical protein